ncbi:MAG: hypothetical protein JWQ03_3090 [Variovorax sp.]|nr:hypothetical protein [Variovorax sp.]
MSEKQPIETAPLTGGWILGFVGDNEDSQAKRLQWMMLTRSDQKAGWCDDDGNEWSPTIWVPLPDPQPEDSGWRPAAGTIRIVEITGEGWTCDGKPIEVPYRWTTYVERPDGSMDEYREWWPYATFEEAERRATKWQQAFSLPIVVEPLASKVVTLRPQGQLQ